MNKSRIFYGVFCADPVQQSWFDLLILLANPLKEKRTRAHITLQGPYSAEKNISSSDSCFDRKTLVCGLKNFATECGQALVVALQINGIENVWDKPSFPDGILHITIYEGAELEYAKQLQHCLEKSFKNKWTFEISKLQRIDQKMFSVRDFPNYMVMREIFKAFTGRELLGHLQLIKLSHDERLDCIRKVLQFSVPSQRFDIILKTDLGHALKIDGKNEL